NVTGVNANFIAASLVEAGMDPKAPARPFKPDMNEELDHEHKAWKDIWSAGHGVGTIVDSPRVGELVEQLETDYFEAIAALKG
ncbi:MAG: nitronate monooxygenase, partial [Geminicoccaceae bacterium]